LYLLCCEVNLIHGLSANQRTVVLCYGYQLSRRPILRSATYFQKASITSEFGQHSFIYQHITSGITYLSLPQYRNITQKLPQKGRE